MISKTFILHTQRVVQNNQEFLLGVFNIEDILKFTRYTEYTILDFDEENDNKPVTNPEVQRKLSPSKVNAIVDFLIHDPLAIFPTNLVVSIPNHVIAKQVENSQSGLIDIHLDSKVFTEIEKLDKSQSGEIYLSVIDGQHRIRGIENTIKFLEDEIRINAEMVRTSADKEKYQKKITDAKHKLDLVNKIQLPVTFFIDPVLEYQAMIFSTINRTQTKVPPDLVYSLFGLAKGDSPQKTVLNIVNTLNGRESSPFYKRIRLAGSGTVEARSFYKNGNPVLSQATMVKAILTMIYVNKREEEIGRHKGRKYFVQNPGKGVSFRKYFAQDEDARILRILYSYFTAVQNSFKNTDGTSYWEFDEKNTRKPKNILHTTIGFIALLDILKIILKIINEEENDKIEVYEKFLIKANDIDFADNHDPKKYPFANSTKNIFYNDLGEKIFGNTFEKRITNN